MLSETLLPHQAVGFNAAFVFKEATCAFFVVRPAVEGDQSKGKNAKRGDNSNFVCQHKTPQDHTGTTDVAPVPTSKYGGVPVTRSKLPGSAAAGSRKSHRRTDTRSLTPLYLIDLEACAARLG